MDLKDKTPFEITDLLKPSNSLPLTEISLCVGSEKLCSNETGILYIDQSGCRLEIEQFVPPHALSDWADETIAGELISELPRIKALIDNFEFQASFSSLKFKNSQTSVKVTSPKFVCKTEFAGFKSTAYLANLPNDFPRLKCSGSEAGTTYEVNFVSGDPYVSVQGSSEKEVYNLLENLKFTIGFLSGKKIFFKVVASCNEGFEKTKVKFERGNGLAPYPIPLPLNAFPYSVVSELIQFFVHYFLDNWYSPSHYFLEHCWAFAKTGQISHWLLTVAVSIEGLCAWRVEEKNLAVTPDSHYELLVDRLSKVAEEWLSESLNADEEDARKHARDRFLNSMKRRNLLSGKPLVSAGFNSLGLKITTKELNFWKAGRNATAHGGFSSSTTKEKRLKQFHACVSLFYRFILGHSGYRGRYIEYAERGWPEKDFIKLLVLKP